MDENFATMKVFLVTCCTALGAFLGWKGIMLLSWVAVMALDYLSGTMAACKAGQWSSGEARQGLWHKGGMILVVVVSAITDVVMVVMVEYIPIGVQWPGIILPLVLAWYILTELGSILENAVALGANVPSWLIGLLKAGMSAVDSVADAEYEQLN